MTTASEIKSVISALRDLGFGDGRGVPGTTEKIAMELEQTRSAINDLAEPLERIADSLEALLERLNKS